MIVSKVCRADSPTAGTAARPVGLAPGATLRAHSVVLALGHIPSRLNPEQRELQASAGQLGLRYLLGGAE